MESGLQWVIHISMPRSDVHSFRSHLTRSHTSRLQSVTIQIFPFLHGAWCITDHPSKPQRELTRRWTATPLPLTFSAVLGFDFISWFCIDLGLRFGVRHLWVVQRKYLLCGVSHHADNDCRIRPEEQAGARTLIHALPAGQRACWLNTRPAASLACRGWFVL